MSLGPKINFGDDVLVVGEDEAQSCNFKVKIAACRHAAGGKQELGFPQGKPLLPACSHNWAQTDPVPSYLLVHSAFPFCQLAGSTWGRCVSFFLFFPLMTNVQVFLLLLVPPCRRHVVKHTDVEISRRSSRTSPCFFSRETLQRSGAAVPGVVRQDGLVVVLQQVPHLGQDVEPPVVQDLRQVGHAAHVHLLRCDTDNMFSLSEPRGQTGCRGQTNHNSNNNNKSNRWAETLPAVTSQQ